jgi:hypothetical protein
VSGEQRIGSELTPQQIERLADYYHERECTRNHTDGCGWFYEKAASYPPTAKKWEHDSWAKRVPALLARDRQQLDVIRIILGEWVLGGLNKEEVNTDG